MKRRSILLILLSVTIFILFLFKFFYTPTPLDTALPTPTPTASPLESPVESPRPTASPITEITPTPTSITTKQVGIQEMANSLKIKIPKESKSKVKVVPTLNDLIKNEEEHPATLTGLWRGEIKLSKDIIYSLIINRHWDYMTDEYLASSCVGIEESDTAVYKKALYNTLKFYETKTLVDGKEKFSLVCIIGDKYVLNVALPATEETTQVDGIAYFKHGQTLQYLGMIELTKDVEDSKSDCSDFEYKQK